MSKVRVNLYLEKGPLERFRAALGATGQTLSGYVNHVIREDVEVLELVAQGGDRQQVAQRVKEKTVDKLTDSLATEFGKLADFMRMIQDESEGKEHEV
jgi:uncharacterized damage-inducible protein DinB